MLPLPHQCRTGGDQPEVLVRMNRRLAASRRTVCKAGGLGQEAFADQNGWRKSFRPRKREFTEHRRADVPAREWLSARLSGGERLCGLWSDRAYVLNWGLTLVERCGTGKVVSESMNPVPLLPVAVGTVFPWQGGVLDQISIGTFGIIVLIVLAVIVLLDSEVTWFEEDEPEEQHDQGPDEETIDQPGSVPDDEHRSVGERIGDNDMPPGRTRSTAGPVSERR